VFSYTELVLELEYLKIETRLITEMFVNVMERLEPKDDNESTYLVYRGFIIMMNQ
jgi:hypothetical protein